MKSEVAYGVEVAPGSYADRILSTEDTFEKEKILNEFRNTPSCHIKIGYPEFVDSNVSFEDLLNSTKICVNKVNIGLLKESIITLPVLVDFLKFINCLDRTVDLTLFCNQKMFTGFRLFGSGIRAVNEEVYIKIGCYIEVFGIPVIVNEKFPTGNLVAVIPDHSSRWPNNKFNMAILEFSNQLI